MSDNTALERLYCSDNQLTASALNDLFSTLRENPNYSHAKNIGWMNRPFRLYMFNNPGTSDCDVSIAQAKGWVVNEI